MPYGSDAWGSSAWSQYSDSGKMGKAVAVGQDNASNCLVAYLDPNSAQWNSLSCLPTIPGILNSCYADSTTSLWVCGSNGSAPILYFYAGATWIDYSSSITAIDPSVALIQVKGSSPTNVYATGSNGAVYHFDGVSWSKVFTHPDTTSISICVNSTNGNCYVTGTPNHYCYSDVSGLWALFRPYDANWQYYTFSEIENGNMICYALNTYSWIYSEMWEIDVNGALVDNWVPDTGIASVHPGIYTGNLKSADDFWYKQHATDLVGHCVNRSAVNYTIGDNPWSSQINGICVSSAVDIWCGGAADAVWGGDAVLSHWEGATTWSGPADYNSDGLNAKVFQEIIEVDTDFSFSSITPERNVVAVGRDNSGNCLVATFAPSVWTRRTEFPTITGHLFSVCAPYDGVFWVAGGTGAFGQISPLLYFWNGSQFVNHSAALTDAVSLWSIRCQGPDNVWVVGKATGALDHGAWHFDGSGWTSTKVNTIAVGRGDLANSIFCSVSAEGNCYISSWLGGTEQKIFTNLATPGFVEMFYCHTICGTNPIYATADDQIRVSLGNGGYVSRKYDGISWTYSGSLPGGSYASCLGVLDFANWFWVETSNGVGSAYRVGLAIEKIANTLELATNLAGRLFISRTDGRPDIWVGSGVHDYGRWVGSGIAQLTHWKGCTEWSGPSEYDVAALDAQLWHDLASSSALPPLPSRETLTIAPGAFYIDRVRLV